MPAELPHRRLNPLTGEWVLVSPQRTERPWQGHVELAAADRVAYDAQCYLCPGNSRAGGWRNPHYTSTFVFDNDYPALLPPESQAGHASDPSPLFAQEAEPGLCRVVCYSPRHDLTLPELSLEQVRAVVETWRSQTLELAALDFIHHVQVFENKGEAMGCSNPHPHSQVWASRHVPNEPAKEAAALQAYLARTGSCLVCDLAREEAARGTRVVAGNASFIAIVPFWAVWPFETLVLARRHVAGLPDLEPGETQDLAEILRTLTILYDNLFEVSFPLHDGLPPGCLARAASAGGSPARAFLSAAPALGLGAQVHGGIRDAGHAATRPDTRDRSGCFAPITRDALLVPIGSIFKRAQLTPCEPRAAFPGTLIEASPCG